MSRADRAGVFARAIAADERSYTPQMFPESMRVRGGERGWGAKGRAGGGGRKIWAGWNGVDEGRGK